MLSVHQVELLYVYSLGRMIDHVMNTMSVDLDDIEVIVLDEADRLLELGFTDEVINTYIVLMK